MRNIKQKKACAEDKGCNQGAHWSGSAKGAAVA